MSGSMVIDLKALSSAESATFRSYKSRYRKPKEYGGKGLSDEEAAIEAYKKVVSNRNKLASLDRAERNKIPQQSSVNGFVSETDSNIEAKRLHFVSETSHSGLQSNLVQLHRRNESYRSKPPIDTSEAVKTPLFFESLSKNKVYQGDLTFVSQPPKVEVSSFHVKRPHYFTQDQPFFTVSAARIASNPMPPLASRLDLYLQVSLLALASVTCWTAEIYLGAESGGFTREAWFWSAFTGIGGAGLLLYRTNGFLKTSFCRLLGICFLFLSYFVMHTSISEKTGSRISAISSNSEEVVSLNGEVSRLEREVEPMLKIMESLDPVRYPSKIQQLNEEIEKKNSQISSIREKISAARERTLSSGNVLVAESWGIVDGLRRLAVILLGVISGHGLISAAIKLKKDLFHHTS